MITLILEDNTTRKEISALEEGLTVEYKEGGKDTETLNGDLHTFNTFRRVTISHTWAFMDAEEYEELRGFYERQFTTLKYPELTCEGLGLKGFPVRLVLGDRNIIDECLTHKGVKLKMIGARNSASS